MTYRTEMILITLRVVANPKKAGLQMTLTTAVHLESSSNIRDTKYKGENSDAIRKNDPQVYSSRTNPNRHTPPRIQMTRSPLFAT